MRWNRVELEGALEEMMKKITINIVMLGPLVDGIDTTRKMPISDQEFLTDPKSPLKKSYL